MAPAAAWNRGPVCGVDNCRSRLYRHSDGLTICQFGHVMEGGIEINDDQDQTQITTRRLNVLHVDDRGSFTSTNMSQSQSSLASSNGKGNRLYGKEGKKLLYQCFQILLKKQFETCVEVFLSESIKEDLELVIKTNWIKIMNQELGDEDDVSHNYKAMYHLDLIALIYLSILQLRFQPLYTIEIIDKIKTNEIPYIKCLHLIPTSLLTKLPNEYLLRLQASSLPIKNEFYYSIETMAHRLYSEQSENPVQSIDIPINYYYPYIFKILTQDLLLPNAIDLFNTYIVLVNKLYKKDNITEQQHNGIIPLTTKYNRVNRFYQIIKFPEIKLISILIFLIKLSSITTKHTSLFTYQINFKHWYNNLTKFESNNEYKNYVETSNVNDLINWSDDKIDKYCDWVYDQLIPKKNKTYITEQDNNGEKDTNEEELTIMEKRLFQIFNIDMTSSGSESETSSPEPSTAAQKRRKRNDGSNTIVTMKDVLRSGVPSHINTNGDISNHQKKKSKSEDMIDLNNKLVNKFTILLGITNETLTKSILDAESDIQKALMN
ncbi:hypothetical protein DFJ63DRAFT_311751 [Scheffersomyces coipomensis]|uniref:uncharacterized protein n=1 Tax=Scheffersomyces coipomensis TaxID=1788519 RepID=UPI00315D8DA1